MITALSCSDVPHDDNTLLVWASGISNCVQSASLCGKNEEITRANLAVTGQLLHRPLFLNCNQAKALGISFKAAVQRLARHFTMPT